MVGYILGLVISGLYVDKSIIFTTKKQNEVYESVKGALGSGVKNAYESVKEKLSNASDAVGSGVKSVCNAMPSTESVRNRVPSLKTVGWIAGGTGLLVGATYIAANGGLGVAGNSSNAVGNSTNSTESGVSIPNSSSVYQQIMQIQIDEASKKLADAEKFAENNFGMSEEDEPQWSKNLTNHTYSNNTASKAEANPITNLSDTTLSFPPVTSLVVVGG